jgi:hypothetical protein
VFASQHLTLSNVDYFTQYSTFSNISTIRERDRRIRMRQAADLRFTFPTLAEVLWACTCLMVVPDRQMKLAFGWDQTAPEPCF